MRWLSPRHYLYGLDNMGTLSVGEKDNLCIFQSHNRKDFRVLNDYTEFLLPEDRSLNFFGRRQSTMKAGRIYILLVN